MGIDPDAIGAKAKAVDALDLQYAAFQPTMVLLTTLTISNQLRRISGSLSVMAQPKARLDPIEHLSGTALAREFARHREQEAAAYEPLEMPLYWAEELDGIEVGAGVAHHMREIDRLLIKYPGVTDVSFAIPKLEIHQMLGVADFRRQRPQVEHILKESAEALKNGYQYDPWLSQAPGVTGSVIRRGRIDAKTSKR